MGPSLVGSCTLSIPTLWLAHPYDDGMSFAPLRCPAPGSTIAIVAPAGPATEEQTRAVPALLAARGYQARLYPSCEARAGGPFGHLAGSDESRLADLHEAIADERNAAVWCLRGGYGSGRLLQHIDTALIRRHPKPLIGYSDITALHALWQREGLLALHAPMPASDLVRAGHEADADAVFAWLQQGLPCGTLLVPELATPALHAPGVASGRLVGGNLTLVAALCGTPWQLDTRGAVLFIEDVSESLYRVDRLLLQLRHAGLLDAAAGFLLGSFAEDEDPFAVVGAELLPLCRAQGKPLLGGWPAGHGVPNRPLPMGARVTLDATHGTLRVDQDVLLR